MVKFISKFCLIILLLVFSVPAIGQPSADQAPLRYNYTYKMTNKIKKSILLFFKVRIYYIISASVNFTAKPTSSGGLHFTFDGINGTAYKIRTFRNGKHFVLITADYDVKKNDRFIEDQVQHYLKNVPSWSKYVQKIKRHPFLITTRGEDVIQFTRSRQGIHQDLINRMKLTRIYPERPFDNIVNLYETMMETLKFYNHSFAPRNTLSDLPSYTNRTWLSPSQNYTERITTLIRLLFKKKDLEPWGKFNQQGDFRLTYRISNINDETIKITGEAFPNEKVWRFIRMGRVARTVILKRADNTLLEDSFQVDLRDKKGMGQYFETSLKLIQ